jgi:uncharacterized membrane protein
MKPINSLTKLLVAVLSMVTLFVSNAVFAQSGDQVVYIDPFSFWMLLLGIIVMVVIVFFAIGVNTAITQREAEHRMNVENRYLDIYDKLVNNTIYYQNTLLNYYGQQLVTQDIRQLMSDRVKASVVQSAKPPTVESYQLQGEMFPPFPQPQGGGQNPQQGSSSTK